MWERYPADLGEPIKEEAREKEKESLSFVGMIE